MSKRTLVSGLIIFFMLFVGLPAMGGERGLYLKTPLAKAQELTPVQRGRGKAQICTRCHGRYGLAQAAKAQNWKGTVAEFIITQLQAFRAKKRNNLVMYSVAKPMSDIDMADVAAWYEKISGVVVSE